MNSTPEQNLAAIRRERVKRFVAELDNPRTKYIAVDHGKDPRETCACCESSIPPGKPNRVCLPCREAFDIEVGTARGRSLLLRLLALLISGFKPSPAKATLA